MTTDLLGPLSTVRMIEGIDQRQATSLEAIGFGLDTVNAVYLRLASSLEGFPASTELAFADAWAIVDWMYRLDGLVRGCRGLTPRDEPVAEFLNTSSLVENLRHMFQHPEGTLPEVTESNRSLWGHLSWQTGTPEGHEVLQITSLGRWTGGVHAA